MKNSTLAQATLLALTRQNLTQKAGPKNTYTVKAVCVQRNIREGETVIVEKNNDGEINRLSDMLSFNSPFFVDSKNRLYDRVSSGDILRVRDGLSGDVLSQGETAYNLKVFPGVMGYCTTRAQDNDNHEVWVFVYEDGTKSNPITMPYTGTGSSSSTIGYGCVFGYRNGILAIAQRGTGATQYVWTYTKQGELLYRLAKVGAGLYPYPAHLFPISETAVGVWYSYSIGLYTQMRADGYQVTYTDHVDSYGFLYQKLYTPVASGVDNGCVFLGCDQNYFYASSRMHNEDNTAYLDEWPLCRFSIDDYDGAEEITRLYASPQYSSVNNREHLTVRYSSHAYVLDRATMGQAFSGELDLSSNTTINMMENDGYIWDSPSGIYQKTSLGTVMYPSSIYPKASPYGQCGYALYSVTVGSVGEAVILFS